jgi:hypothetical protein
MPYFEDFMTYTIDKLATQPTDKTIVKPIVGLIDKTSQLNALTALLVNQIESDFSNLGHQKTESILECLKLANCLGNEIIDGLDKIERSEITAQIN